MHVAAAPTSPCYASSLMDGQWVRIDSARRLGDATLLKLALESHGIQVGLRGEHLPSIAGELPLGEAEIELWVPAADAARAREALDALHRTQVDGPPRICPRCSEENPSNFDLCWSCQWPLFPSESDPEP